MKHLPLQAYEGRGGLPYRWKILDARANVLATGMTQATALEIVAAVNGREKLVEALKRATRMCPKCCGNGTYLTGCPCVDDPRWEPDYHPCGAHDTECDQPDCAFARKAISEGGGK